MQVSYFETGRYHAPSNLPRQWPMPAGTYDREAGLRAFHGMVERSRYVEELGFDWVSVSEHHYSPRILTPSLPIADMVSRNRSTCGGPDPPTIIPRWRRACLLQRPRTLYDGNDARPGHTLRHRRRLDLGPERWWRAAAERALIGAASSERR